jgi:hypothetical protein
VRATKTFGKKSFAIIQFAVSHAAERELQGRVDCASRVKCLPGVALIRGERDKSRRIC